ncbi:hypothetical protein LL13F59_36320 [Escherichia coli]
MFAGKKSAQIREILISESTWEEMTCLFAPSLSVCMFGMYSYFVLYIVFRCDLVCQLIAFKKYVL